MKTYIQQGEALTIPAPANVTSGQGLLIGGLFGVVATTALSGEDVAVHRIGVFEMPKLAAQAWTVGAKVYWDNANARCTTVATANTLIGCAAAAAANPSDTGIVALDGAVR